MRVPKSELKRRDNLISARKGLLQARSWTKVGFLFDEHHCVFVCLNCPDHQPVLDPASHFNETHQTQADPTAERQPALKPDILEVVPVKKFDHSPTAMMRPIRGIPILGGFCCRDCKLCCLTTCDQCINLCNAPLDRVQIQQVGQGENKIAYRVDTGFRQAPPLGVSVDSSVRESGITESLTKTHQITDGSNPPSRPLALFPVCKVSLSEQSELDLCLWSSQENLFARPTSISDRIAAWLEDELVTQWLFADSQADCGASSLNWRKIAARHRKAYMRKSIEIIYGAINLFD